MRILLRGVHPCVIVTAVGVVAVIDVVEAFVRQHQRYHRQHPYYQYQQHPGGTQKKKKSRNHNSNSNSIFLLHLQEDDAALEEDEEKKKEQQQQQLMRRRREFVLDAVGAGLLVASGSSFYQLYQTNLYTPPGIERFHWSSPQFLAALGDPTASNGTIPNNTRNNKESSWGIWEHDPGPRGVKLQNFQQDILATQYRAQPVGWTFDPQSWWLEEHGLIMESPTFPVPDGMYLVTGGRFVTTVLTIANQGTTWSLDAQDGATLYDVTHLPCRAARYEPLAVQTTKDDDDAEAIGTDLGSPLSANRRDFPVKPGARMPTVPGTNKHDYAVVFVVGKGRG